MLTHLKLLQLLLSHSIENTRGVGQGCSFLRCFQPIFELGVIIQKLLPQPPCLFNSTKKKVESNGKKNAYAKLAIFLNSLWSCKEKIAEVILLESPLHGHGADVPPASVQASGCLLDGVALCLCGAGVAVMQQDFAQVKDWRHTCAVFLYVPLKVLEKIIIDNN